MPGRTVHRLALVASLHAVAARAGAQSLAAPTRSWREATVGTEYESYLRALQLDTALATPFPQTIRTFSSRQLSAMRPRGAHPWSAAVVSTHDGASIGVQLLRPSARLIANSGFPFGMNDGPVWAGRGLTTVLRAGALVLAGPVTVRVEPIAFRAENNGFPLVDNGGTGDARFRDPVSPTFIDLPQRFGTGAYQRVDLGESELRVDAPGVAVGVSNAMQSWGPGVTHPLILGPNGPGFVHAFVETSRPLPIFIGRLHARLVSGRLEQSRYSPTTGAASRRNGTGVVASFLPRGLDGLEVGGSRFFHSGWSGWGDLVSGLRTPLNGLLLKRGRFGVDDTTSAQFLPDNQLASLFLRWAFPQAGFEFYGEYAREDAAVDLRDLLAEPDHSSAYMLGFRRLLHRRGNDLALVRGEFVNARITQLTRVRPQAPFYTHTGFTQGHTNRGEVLGSVAALGSGSGLNLGADFYSARGRTSVDFNRLPRLVAPDEGAANLGRVDVQHALTLERTVFVRGLDLVGGVTGVWELNRNYGRDAFDLGATLGVRLGRNEERPLR
jgi:hypothetical protein